MVSSMKHWRNLALAALSLALLAGCSRHTAITVEVDLRSFLAEEDRSGELSVLADEYFLPDDQGVSAAELGFPVQFLELLESFTLDLSAALTSNAASGSEQVTVGFHLSDSADASPFASPALVESTVSLDPGETEQLDFSIVISSSENAEELATLRSGDFRIGVRLEYVAGPDASGVDYRLDVVNVSITALPRELILF
jgi:hypothetical protein